ncbi:MAG TPA: arsenite methyltransferase [Terriglobales bacterium]|jgi:SAM-dependent methyltransferase|nr:arsenite methyltransferase [Terriglobales bacterium]
MPAKETDIVEVVRERYGAIARGERSGCGCSAPGVVAKAIGYTEEDLALAQQANLGLGCGNPLALAAIRPGMTVLDLGSGAGFDAFLAWRRVGPNGRVIGVDMTDDMLAQARRNAEDLGASNVEFRKGRIEKLPVEDGSIDLVISNCVINLSTDKAAVFREIYRVLKPGATFAISDPVLLKELPESVAKDVGAYVGCVAGASLLTEYVRLALEAGLANMTIPQMTPSGKLLVAYGLESPKPASGCCGGGNPDQWMLDAASAVVSVKLHGTRPA